MESKLNKIGITTEFIESLQNRDFPIMARVSIEEKGMLAFINLNKEIDTENNTIRFADNLANPLQFSLSIELSRIGGIYINKKGNGIPFSLLDLDYKATDKMNRNLNKMFGEQFYLVFNFKEVKISVCFYLPKITIPTSN